MSDMRTPLGRVRGLGSAHEGTGQFWRVRLTSIALIPLSLFTIGWLLSLKGASYAEVRASLSQPLVTLVVALFLRRRLWGLVAVLSALALGSLGFIGHAEMEEGLAAWLDQASQFLHLISAGFWLGSLLPLLVCLRPHGNAADQEAIATTLRRFSGYGHFAVAIILATGVANAWFVLGTLHLDPAVPYQALLIAKLLLVGVLVGLALANRYIFMPWIGDGAGLRALRVGTIAESRPPSAKVSRAACRWSSSTWKGGLATTAWKLPDAGRMSFRCRASWALRAAKGNNPSRIAPR